MRSKTKAALAMALLDGKALVADEGHGENIGARQAREEAHRWKAPVVLQDDVAEAGSFLALASVAAMNFAGYQESGSPKANAFACDNKI